MADQISDDYSDRDRTADTQVLHSMGYAQELERRMSRFSNFAISFSIICILSGGINSLAQATSGAGGAAIGIGWPLGCLISAVFAVSMAQIASAYPTAGGLYHWGSILGNRFIGWVTAWFNLIGLVTVLGAINVGTWTFFGGSIGAKLGINIDATTWPGYTNQIIFMVVITGAQALINHMGISLTAKLTDFSGYLIFFTAILLAVLCLAFAPSYDLSRLWTFSNYSGLPETGEIWPKSDSAFYVFLLGLLLPIYTITGYDASAHTSEETMKAAHSVPRGIISSVWWSALFGWIMLCAFVLMIPDMNEAAKQGWNVFFWAVEAQMPAWAEWLLYICILAAQFLCGLATVTSVSRMIFAFARDGGLPASGVLKKVSPAHRTPVAAIWTGAVLAVLFTAYTAVYTTVVSVTVIFLFISFAIPIACGFAAWGKTWTHMGPWNLGETAFKFFAGLSVLSALLILFLGVQPPNDKALWITIFFFGLTAVVWFLFENKRFQGPPIGDMIALRQKAILEAEKAVGEIR
jgi:amino acid transporter